MWKEIVNSEYFFEFTQNNGFQICATDYVAVWTTNFSKKSFLSQLKHCNEGLELPNENDYIKKGIHMLLNLDQLKKISLRKEENGEVLFISMRIILGCPFYFESKLSKGSEQFYFEKITKPLLKTIGDLRASQTELRRLLIKKDKEIDEYKCEGGEIVLRHLKTVAFNDEEHMKKFKTYEENFGATNIPASLIEKSLLPNNIQPEPSTTPIIKQEPNSMKQEPSSIKQESPNIKQEPNNKKQESSNIKQESLNIKQEPNSTTQESSNIKQESLNIKQESPNIKQESPNIKQEPHTPVFEDTQTVPTGSCKQEMTKTERPTRNDRRKRPKLNY